MDDIYFYRDTCQIDNRIRHIPKLSCGFLCSFLHMRTNRKHEKEKSTLCTRRKKPKLICKFLHQPQSSKKTEDNMQVHKYKGLTLGRDMILLVHGKVPLQWGFVALSDWRWDGLFLHVFTCLGPSIGAWKVESISHTRDRIREGRKIRMLLFFFHLFSFEYV